MSSPWIFNPNCAASVWLAPSDPTTDPPDYAGLDCQQLKPFFHVFGPLPTVLIHRFILRQSDLGNVGSTDLFNGMWLRLNDTAGAEDIHWFSINDLSPFAYNDAILGYIWEFVLFSGRLSNF